MNALSVKAALREISNVMTENREYLISLDRQNGDGDLGISMSDGFKAAADFVAGSAETDLGKIFFRMSTAFNEKAPSTLGTILSFGMMGMAKALKGKNEAPLPETADALSKGIEAIMEKAGAKPGEKTILDSLCPAVEALKKHSNEGDQVAYEAAAKAAADGSESTKNMLSKHGRAAYYGEKSAGVLDGGSVVGRLIFEALYQYQKSVSA